MSPSDAFARASRRARAGGAARSRILDNCAAALHSHAVEITISQASRTFALASVLHAASTKSSAHVNACASHRHTGTIFSIDRFL